MTILIWICAAFCAAIAGRLITYQPRPTSARRPGMAFLAWATALAAMLVVVRVASGDITGVDPGLVALIAVLCFAVYSADGNIARLCDARPRPLKPTAPHGDTVRS